MTSPAPNQYGNLAQHHWRIHCPTAYRQIDNPREFFYRLGEQIADQVDELAWKLAGPDSLSEAYLHKVGRLNTARAQAEETVLADLVYSQLETSGEEPGDEFATDVPLSESSDPFFQELAQMRQAFRRIDQEE